MPRIDVSPEELSRRSHVLLAEDDTDLRRLLAGALEQEGYHVRQVGSGRELREELEVAPGQPLAVDLIVSDVRMPGFSGLDVLSFLRQRDWATPVLLITAFGDEAVHQEAHRLGAAAVIDKPFELDELRHAARALAPPVV